MRKIQAYIDKVKKKTPTVQIRVESPKNDFFYEYSSHEKNQSFHSASIGKMFCSTLILMAIEKSLIKLDSKVSNLLGAKTLDNLFMYKGYDYRNDVTIEHLLSHTSGINDYFEGKTFNKRNFLKEVLKDKNHIYTPNELLDFTKNNQHAIGIPGKKFLYSDSGFLLLGFILEEIYQQSYSNILIEQIIRPLALNDTHMCFHDDDFDQSKLAPILFKGVRMELAKSLSCDYSGGGLQTSAKDLATFLKALFSQKLVSNLSLLKMIEPRNSFHGVMRYGLGMIELKLNRLAPWLIDYESLFGGVGSLSVLAFYDLKNNDVYIINLGDSSKMRLSFFILIKMAKLLKKKHKITMK